MLLYMMKIDFESLEVSCARVLLQVASQVPSANKLTEVLQVLALK